MHRVIAVCLILLVNAPSLEAQPNPRTLKDDIQPDFVRWLSDSDDGLMIVRIYYAERDGPENPPPVVVAISSGMHRISWEDDKLARRFRDAGFVFVAVSLATNDRGWPNREEAEFYAFKALPSLKDFLTQWHNLGIINARRIGVFAAGAFAPMAVGWASYEFNIARADEAGWVKSVTVLQPRFDVGISAAGRLTQFASNAGNSITLVNDDNRLPERRNSRRSPHVNGSELPIARYRDELKGRKNARFVSIDSRDKPATIFTSAHDVIFDSFKPLLTQKIEDPETVPVAGPSISRLRDRLIAARLSRLTYERMEWQRTRYLPLPIPVAELRARPSRPYEHDSQSPATPYLIKPTNVLFIAVDDLRPVLGCYGDNLAVTPNIDELSKRSITFDNAYCQQTVGNPSRASVMTGLRPDTLKVWDSRTHFRKHREDVVTLPQYFKNMGFESVCVGKVFHGTSAMQDRPSWTKPAMRAVIPQQEEYHLPANRSKNASAKMAATEASGQRDSEYVDGKTTSLAIEELYRLVAGKTPFFLAVGFRKPHLPFSAPTKYWRRHEFRAFKPLSESSPLLVPSLALHNWKELRDYQDIPADGPLSESTVKELRHGYYACVSFIDAQIGRLLGELARTGADENTLVVLWSDHGFHLGEQGLWGKTSNFELDARVPLLMSIPGRTFVRDSWARWDQPYQLPRRCRSIVELVDLYPTIINLCGWPVPDGLDGEDMLHAMEREPNKLAAFTQTPRPADYKGQPSAMGYSMRTRRYRYTEWVDWKSGNTIARELYDEVEDTGETHNLAHDERFAALLESLGRRLRKSGAASRLTGE